MLTDERLDELRKEIIENNNKDSMNEIKKAIQIGRESSCV